MYRNQAIPPSLFGDKDPFGEDPSQAEDLGEEEDEDEDEGVFGYK